MSYEDLIAKLEAAPEGSIDLDLEVARALHDPQFVWYDRVEGVVQSEKYGLCGLDPHTTSLDAALSLVHQRGWDWTRHRSINGRMTMVVHTDQPLGRHGQGANDAIALLIAYFRAELDYAALEAS
jgi:hypothetical protein